MQHNTVPILRERFAHKENHNLVRNRCGIKLNTDWEEKSVYRLCSFFDLMHDMIAMHSSATFGIFQYIYLNKITFQCGKDFGNIMWVGV